MVIDHGIEVVREALEIQNLQTNTSLLDYGLHLGLFERSTSGQVIAGSLNLKVLSPVVVVVNLSLELLVRLGIFVSATGLVGQAIVPATTNPKNADKLRCLYVFSAATHQIMNFDVTSIRTVNRLLMSIVIMLFGLRASISQPCEDLRKFMLRISYRLRIDYYLWCLLLAMDLVLTWSSTIHINLEQEYGTEINISHIMLSSYCVIQLSSSMLVIGNGLLTLLIMGTPLMFLDAGDNITVAKGISLFLYYLCFWSSDWRELFDWNHPILCKAEICKTLSTHPGDIKTVVREAAQKFDNWRIEEGLDDDGCFIAFDPPFVRSSDTTDANLNADQSIDLQNNSSDNDEEASGSSGQQPEERLTFDTSQAIYLQSRNPLLLTLAAIIIVIWK